MHTLTEHDMFRILDHDCQDRHLWALYGPRWTTVDLNAKTLRLMENRVAVGSEIISGTTKSKASAKTLPIPDEVDDALRAARQRQAEVRLAFGGGYPTHSTPAQRSCISARCQSP